MDSVSYGYKLLYDEMKKNDDIYSIPIMMLAYRINKTLQISQTDTVKTRLNNIYNDLPDSVQLFPWNSVIGIRNYKLNEQFYAIYDGYAYDSKRRRVATWISGTSTSNQSKWQLEDVDNDGLSFYLKSIEYDEYLYANDNDYAYDKKRRSIFTWRPKGKSLQARWQFEPIYGKPYFRIKNVEYDEYLFTESGITLDVKRRLTFTWREFGCYENCYWIINTL